MGKPLRFEVAQVLQILGYITGVLERAPGEWLLVFLVVAFFVGRHGGQIDNWLLDIAKFGLSAVLAVFVENAIGATDLIGGPSALAPGAPPSPFIAVLVFLVIFVVVLVVVNWVLGK
jgi:hypothetical protein